LASAPTRRRWSCLHSSSGAGASPSGAARPFRSDRRDARRGKGLTQQDLVLVAAEADGRGASRHADTTMKPLKSFATPDAFDTHVVDRRASRSYTAKASPRPHHRHPDQTRTRESDSLQGCHWNLSLLTPGCLARIAGAVRTKHCKPTTRAEFRFPLQSTQRQRRRPQSRPAPSSTGRPPAAHDENAEPGNRALSRFPSGANGKRHLFIGCPFH